MLPTAKTGHGSTFVHPLWLNYIAGLAINGRSHISGARIRVQCGWPLSNVYTVHVITPPPIGKSGVLWWACLSVCLSICLCVCVWVFVCPRSYLRNCTTDLQFFVHVNYLSIAGLVLFWRRINTSPISGFVDDVIFAHKLIGCSTSPPGWGSGA